MHVCGEQSAALVAGAFGLALTLGCGADPPEASPSSDAGSAPAKDGSASSESCKPLTLVWGDASVPGDFQGVTGIVGDADGSFFVTGSFSGTMQLGDTVVVSPPGESLFLARILGDGQPAWVEVFPDPEGQQAVSNWEAPRLALSGDGVVMVGTTSAARDFGAGVPEGGGHSTYVTKFSRSGKLLFTHQHATEGWGQGWRSVAADEEGGIVVVGRFASSFEFAGLKGGAPKQTVAAVARFSIGGSAEWLTTLDGKATASAVALTTNGNVVVGGAVSGPLNDGKTLHTVDKGVFVAELDAHGKPLWLRTGETSSPTYVPTVSMAVSSLGELYMAGSFVADLKFTELEITSDAKPASYLARFDGSSLELLQSFAPNGYGSAPFGLDSGDLAAGPEGRVHWVGSFWGQMQYAGALHTSNGSASPDPFLATFSGQGEVRFDHNVDDSYDPPHPMGPWGHLATVHVSADGCRRAAGYAWAGGFDFGHGSGVSLAGGAPDVDRDSLVVVLPPVP